MKQDVKSFPLVEETVNHLKEKGFDLPMKFLLELEDFVIGMWFDIILTDKAKYIEDGRVKEFEGVINDLRNGGV